MNNKNYIKNMFELVYSSKAIQQINDADLKDILKTAREFNAKNEITGCLLFYNNEFVQILEGDKSIVLELFESIKTDKRHNNIKLLSQNNKKERLFKEWRMAFRKLNKTDETDKRLFIGNLTLLSNLYEKPTTTIKLFWEEVLNILNK